ncbi:MAG: type II secretion system protein GspG [Pikeienuella sp.]
MTRSPRKSDPASAEAGFTLLELLVVVTILVALAAAVGPVALKYLGGARADAARLQSDQVKTGLDLWRRAVGRSPAGRAGRAARLARPADAARWNGPSVKGEETRTAPWGGALLYETPGARGRPYEVWSLGADGAEGGEGEDADVGR